MPSLDDPNFERTVTLICQHDSDGALGIVINRPMEIHAADILKELDIDPGTTDLNGITVFRGGPVQPELGLILHETDSTACDFEATVSVGDDLRLTMSIDILEAMARAEGPNRALIALGYAGWGPGQLDTEMTDNAWLSVPATIELLFDTPFEQRWDGAAKSIGIDLNLLSTQSGHA